MSHCERGALELVGSSKRWLWGRGGGYGRSLGAPRTTMAANLIKGINFKQSSLLLHYSHTHRVVPAAAAFSEAICGLAAEWKAAVAASGDTAAPRGRHHQVDQQAGTLLHPRAGAINSSQLVQSYSSLIILLECTLFTYNYHKNIEPPYTQASGHNDTQRLKNFFSL